MEKEKQAVEKFVGILMMSRTYAHMAHLKTSSYLKHVALEELYDGIVDKVDAIAEVAQGKMGLLDIPYEPLKGDVEDPVAGLETHVTMLDNLGKKCDSRAIGAIVDEVLVLYYTTLYKLKELD